jgi:predicted phage terminase large subunit-like protein
VGHGVQGHQSSDYVVGQVWARFGLDAYLLDQMHERLSFTATKDAVRELTRRWPQATAKLVEDKANGTAVIDELKRSITGLIPVSPKDGKYVRAVAISPYVESGHVYLPTERLASWVDGFLEEAARSRTGSTTTRSTP